MHCYKCTSIMGHWIIKDCDNYLFRFHCLFLALLSPPPQLIKDIFFTSTHYLAQLN